MANLFILYKYKAISLYYISNKSKMSIVTEYLSLTKKYKADYGEKTILLMQVGSFFEVYALIKPDGTYTGSSIADFSQINDLSIANKNSVVNELPVAMAGFGTAYRDKYIQRSQEHDYTIVIHEQDPLDKTKRPLTEIISPGTFFPEDNDSYKDNLSNNVMCIWLHKSNATKTMPCQVTLGIANIDIYTGKTALFQFAAKYDHSPATYDELERYISAYKPSECLIVANMPERLIDDIIGFVGLEKTKIHKGGNPPHPPSRVNPLEIEDVGSCSKGGRGGTPLADAKGGNPPHPPSRVNPLEIEDVGSCSKGGRGGNPQGGVGVSPIANAEKQTYQIEILKRFFPHLSSINDMFPTHYIATQAFCYLLDFVYQHNPNLVKKLAEPIFENYTDRLILANHSLNQLNIIDDSRHTGKMRSVSSFLNNCVTTMGKRQFLYLLHYPSTNAATLQLSYDITEHLLQAQQTHTAGVQAQQTHTAGVQAFVNIRQQLSGISDLEKFTRKVVTRKLMPKSFVTLNADLQLIGSLHEQTQTDPVLMKYLPKETQEVQHACQSIMADISKIFNLTACHNVAEINENTLIVNKGIAPVIDALIKESMDGRDKLEAICQYLSGLLQTADKKQSKTAVQYVKIHETAKNPPILIGTSLRMKKLKELLKDIIMKKNNKIAITYESNYSQTSETFELDLPSLEISANGGSKNDMLITNKQIEQITRNNEDNKTKLVREMEKVFQNYITDFAKFDQAMQQIITYTTEMDLLQCKCYIAHKYNYCKPVLSTSDNKDNKSGLR